MVTGPPKFRKKRCHFSIGRMSKSQHKKGMWDGRYCCGYLCEISSSTLGWMCFLSTLSSTPPDLKKKNACVPPSLDCELRQGTVTYSPLPPLLHSAWHSQHAFTELNQIERKNQKDSWGPFHAGCWWHEGSLTRAIKEM